MANKDLIVFNRLETVAGDVEISQRAGDGYVNITQIANAAGKRVTDWLRLDDTKEFLEELSSDTHILTSKLVIVRRGGDYRNQGTWAHIHAAIKFAGWCNKKFELQVFKWFEAWITGKTSTQPEPSEIIRLLFYEDATPWEKRVSDEFYIQQERLFGIKFYPGKGAPVSKYASKVFYDLIICRLPRSVQEELDRLNPRGDDGKRKNTHHQHMKPELRIIYEKLVQDCIIHMMISTSKASFEYTWDLLHPVNREQIQLPLIDPKHDFDN